MDYVLGIDIGTTSVKVCVVRADTGEIVAQIGKDTQSNVPSDQGIDGNKQDVPKIISALNTCVAKLKKDLLQQITRIGICGQMHGVLFWKHTNESAPWDRIEKDNTLVRYDVKQEQVSALYTWQDSRCDTKFLQSLPVPESHLQTYTGFAIATLFWMAKNKPEKLKRYNCAGTIQDFAVAMLCNLAEPVMSDQIAASWGYFNCRTGAFNVDVLRAAAFPVHLLPAVKRSGTLAGRLADNWHSVPKGTPIGIGLGDLQCSVLSTIETARDAVLNVSTSAQIAFVAPIGYRPPGGAPRACTVEYVPYFKNRYIAVAASLNGGNCLATFVKMLQGWSMELGFPVPQAKVWEKVISLGLDESSNSDLIVSPTCLGERHDPNTTASVTNINIGNLELGKVFRALCNGLVANLHSMMPRDVLEEANITRIVGNGSGLSRNKVLQKEVQQLYRLPLVFTSGGDAAKGAALAMNLESTNID